MDKASPQSPPVEAPVAASDSIVDWLAASAARRPSHVAVEEPPDGAITYAALDQLSDRVRDRLLALGVRPGDRVGVSMRKSIDAYATLLGALKAGAAYVPVDLAAPPWRSAFILHDCSVRVAVMDAAIVPAWRAEAAKLGALPEVLELSDVGGGRGLRAALDSADALRPAPRGADAAVGGDALAYILYTSGSTGTPKGVMLTHHCATSHVNWFSEVFAPSEDDRFSSHAPFHFDLSITDLYTPLKHGATVVLIDAERGKEPLGLAQLIAERRLTIWYSTPTILSVLAEFGRMEQHDYSALRQVNFAGEVFPIKHLRAVKALLPRARFANLYGPTETNVCTWHPIPDVIEAERTAPYPIGKTCSHFRSRVVDEEGRDVPRGSEGELVMHGAGMLQGYYNNPERTAKAFLVDAGGRRWYRTGDLVIEGADGVFGFSGRRDRMVKRRGYRIELGEIEAGLYRHEGVKEAAVVALKDAEGGVRIKAFVVMAEGERGSQIAMRAFCAKALPNYMIPDAFGFLDGLPKTSTDKVDYVRLVQAG
jgi:amino acid adenylation domain-containing protein